MAPCIAEARNSDRAPLSWRSERADTLFVGDRARKAAAAPRDPRRASLASLASEAIQYRSLVRLVQGCPQAVFMHRGDISLHRRATAAGDYRRARRVHLQHQFLSLGLGVVKIAHEYV